LRAAMTLPLVAWSWDTSAHVCGFLACRELASLEAADSWLREAISGGPAWERCLEKELRGIQLKGELSGVPTGAARPWQARRSEIKALAFSFLRACVVDTRPVVLTAWGPARELGAALRRAEETAAAHRAKPDSPAVAFLARFYFPAESLTDEAQASSGLIESRPVKFRMGSDELALSMGWKGAIALLKVSGAADAEGVKAARAQSFLVDVWSQDRAPLLRTRGTQVNWPGPWSKLAGVCSIDAPKAAFRAALRDGILCVVCVRGGEITAAEPVSVHIHALHVDGPRVF